MNYQQILPSKELEDYVRYFWILECNHFDGIPKTFKVIADGCPGLIIQDCNPVFFDTKGTKLSQILVYGQTTVHTHNVAFGKFRIIGVYFYPNALKSIFGIDANELKDLQVDLDLIIGIAEKNLSDRILNARSIQSKIEILSTFLLNSIKKQSDYAFAKTKHGISLINVANGNTSLDQIKSDLNVTERSLERMFNQTVGISPKLYMRIVRFQSSLNQLRNQNYMKLADIAYNNGYADQSHFIRDFKAFSGFNPFHFLKQSNELVENFPEYLK
jgi:AraC-like DNA-binding protein